MTSKEFWFTPGGRDRLAAMLARARLLSLALCIAVARPGLALAQSDEIQVYDGGLADRGVLNLTLHNNYTPRGETAPAFPGAVVADRSWNGVPEWAYGVNRWFEAGLYLPLYTLDKHQGWGLNGFKLRTLFAVPDADDQTFVYGTNFEFSFNAERWDPTRFTSEIRPIIGWHLKRVDLFFNPILDTAYDGLGKLEFEPSTRLAYRLRGAWALAVEEYADLGPLEDLHPTSEQAHQLYGVVDGRWRAVDVEFGVGAGLTAAADDVTLKLILSSDLYRRK
jgi:hypothetical protein